MTEPTPILPAHIEDTVSAIARLHADHDERAAPLQRNVDRLTARAGRPEFVVVLALCALLWVALNLLLPHFGQEPIDRPPFAWLSVVASLIALSMTCLILTTQRREDELAEHREQLTLELAILGEQKMAKLIALVEELRRDHPGVHDRIDAEAEAMSAPIDPQVVLDAIKERHQEFAAAATSPGDDAAQGTAGFSRNAELSN